MGYDAAEKLGLKEAWRDLNGLLCIMFAIAFALPFNNNQLDAIPRQWNLANKRGKAFIALLCATAAFSAGTANSYFMIGNKVFKVIALLLPGFAAKAIASDLLLELILALLRVIYPSKYKLPYEAANMLATTIYNLKANENFTANLKNPQSRLSTVARSLIEADKCIAEKGFTEAPELQAKLHNAIQELKQLVKNEEEKIIVTGLLFRTLKYLVGGGAGATAGYFLFLGLGPKAGECIYGSLFDFGTNSLGEVVCAHKSDIGAQIGKTIGYFTLFYQALILIYPAYVLSELLRAGLHNKKSALKLFAYLLVGAGAVLRASIAGFIEWFNTKENPEWLKISFVFSLVFILNCFGMGINGPSTLAILYNTCMKPIGNLLLNCYGWLTSYFKAGNEESLSEESLPLVNHDGLVTANKTLAATAQLLEFFKHRPGLANSLLAAAPEPALPQHSTNSICKV